MIRVEIGILPRSTRRDLVQEHLIELSVGDTIQVGEYRVTVLQINGDELSIEVDGDGDYGWNDGLVTEFATSY